MDLLQVIVLALLQGFTEFLPISSSAHLILVPRFLGWPDQGLAFDVAVHVGTLSAVVFYFRHDLSAMTRAWVRSLARPGASAAPGDASSVTGGQAQDARLAWAVLFGTVPVGLAGLLFKGFIETGLRSPLVIATTTAVFGVLLWMADRHGARVRDEHTLSWRDVLLIGAAQALALIPGTSRSGITITAGLALGLTRAGAARFSFLLSVPVILLAGGAALLDLLESTATVNWRDIGTGAAVSALSAYACIRLFLAFLERIGMAPFAVYRLILAAIILLVFVP